MDNPGRLTRNLPSATLVGVGLIHKSRKAYCRERGGGAISSVEDAVQGQERRIPMRKLKTTRERLRATRFVALLSATALVGSSIAAYAAPPVDISKWSPDYVRSIAGTQDFDTAAECG